MNRPPLLSLPRSRGLSRRAALALGLASGGCTLRDSLLFWPPSMGELDAEIKAALVDVHTPNGQVYALHLPAPPGAPTIVYFHGNAADITSALPLAHRLAAGGEGGGLGVLMLEYPGYAMLSSERSTTPRVVRRATSGVAAFRALLGLDSGQIVLAGYSLGAAVAAQVALCGAAARLVLLAPFSSFSRVARHHGGMVADVLVQEGLDTERIAPLLELPLLLVHGARDTLVPPAMSVALAARAPNARRLLVQGAAHNNLWWAEGGAAPRAVIAFARGGFAGVERSGALLDPR